MFDALPLWGIYLLTVVVFVRDGAPPSVPIALLHLPALGGIGLAAWMLVHDPRAAAVRSAWAQATSRDAP
jgi:hypothetical protein